MLYVNLEIATDISSTSVPLLEPTLFNADAGLTTLAPFVRVTAGPEGTDPG